MRTSTKLLAGALTSVALASTPAHAFFFFGGGEPDPSVRVLSGFPDFQDFPTPTATTLLVRNQSRAFAVGPIDFEVYLSADETLDDSDLLVGTRTLPFLFGRFAFPLFVDLDVPEGATVPGFNLIATVSSPADRNLDNNVAVSDRALRLIGGFTLTLLHSNDGESQLINAGAAAPEFGGLARFATLVENLKVRAEQDTDGFVLVSSGDTFIPSPELDASLNDGIIYDALGLDVLDYDAFIIGNHDFDLGPSFFADFIETFPSGESVFVSANLDFSGEPELQTLVDAGRIASGVIVDVAGRDVAIIGATTPDLPTISSPGAVEVIDEDGNGVNELSDVVIIVQDLIDQATEAGIDVVIFVSHLQGIDSDVEVISQLSGVDLAVAGGGDELQANEPILLVPGDAIAEAYPRLIEDVDGNAVPTVTTAGEYRYVGRGVATFDFKGNLRAFSGNPVRVSGVEPDAVEENAFIAENVVAPVKAFVDNLAAIIVGTSEVGLDGQRDSTGGIGIRNVETNLGNLIGDSFIFTANERAADFGAPLADVALANGGGIRNANIIPAGPISVADVNSILAFSNILVTVPDISAAQFKSLLERAVSGRPGESGRFAQIAGFTFEYDASFTAQEVTGSGADVIITVPGERVRTVTLDDGTPIVVNGQVVPGAPSVNIATVDFLATGGDAYPYQGAPFIPLGIQYNNALRNFIEAPTAQGGLGGLIPAAVYPLDGNFRTFDLTP
ncbi:MAG: bifunctional metallophosphatase/5'-nucleotidase [Opitutales bacterium]